MLFTLAAPHSVCNVYVLIEYVLFLNELKSHPPFCYLNIAVPLMRIKY